MIIARLQGGLGNQLFEYAFGRAIAIKNGVELALDLSQYAEDPQRQYALGAFRIKASIAALEEISSLLGKTRLERKLRRLFGLSHLVREPHYAFWPPALNARDSSYLDGYWQSEKYFEEIAPTLREELTLAQPLSGAAVAFAESLDVSSVSIHVRRTDYLHSQFTVLEADYYERAIAAVRARISDPRFFVFSDDIAWVREHLSIPNATFVSGTAGSDAEELVLMSRCAHHVIANSSFSWWGAWLDPRPEKMVIAPRRWFVLDVHDTKDLLPSGWTTL